MSDTATGSKTAKPAKKKGLGQGWNTAADGASVSRGFSFDTTAEGAKFAKRVLQMAEKAGHAVDLRFGGKSVTVALKAVAGAVADAERRLAKRLEGKRSDADKAAKVARVAAKANKPAKAPKAAKPLTSKPKPKA